MGGFLKTTEKNPPRWRLVMQNLLLATLVACATLGVDPSQTVNVVAVDAVGEARKGLHCSLRNDKGEWHLAVPGSIELLRSNQPLQVECTDVQGSVAIQGEVEAIDERLARATGSAKRYGIVGAIAPPIFMGVFAPAAVVYMVVSGAVFGSVGAAGRAATDTVTDSGFAYPPRIELRDGEPAGTATEQ
jgi:hypothetical protein